MIHKIKWISSRSPKVNLLIISNNKHKICSHTLFERREISVSAVTFKILNLFFTYDVLENSFYTSLRRQEYSLCRCVFILYSSLSLYLKVFIHFSRKGFIIYIMIENTNWIKDKQRDLCVTSIESNRHCRKNRNQLLLYSNKSLKI